MGQSSSRDDVAPLPEIATAEQFEERFRDLFGSKCILPPETEWLEIATAKFGSTKETAPSHWTEADVVEFLAITFPSELQADLRTVRPLLYRCLLRLGSFPYLNRPAPTLTADVMRVALAILIQRHQQTAAPVGCPGRIVDSEDLQAHGMRSLLFQSMRAGAEPLAKRQSAYRRIEVDDEYLLQAYEFVSNRNNRRPKRNPTRIIFGPPMIPVEDLPSSGSVDYSGTIPKDQFASLIKICQALGSGVTEEKEGHGLPNTDRSVGVGWDDFSATIGSAQSSLLDGLAALFTPFILPPDGIDSIKCASAKGEAVELLRKGGPPLVNAKYEWTGEPTVE